MAKKRSKKLRLGLVELITILFMIGGYAAWNSSAKGSTEPSIKRLAKKKKSTTTSTTANDTEGVPVKTEKSQETASTTQVDTVDLATIPEFDGETTFVTINGGVPNFPDEDKTSKAFKYFSPLDNLGRVGVSYANLGRETMPAKGEKRGKIGQVKPSGWHTFKFDFVDGKYLYNRSHMIGWQLSGENANDKNLATGTRFFNVNGMLPFENLVADYIKNTGNHVLYRVTPVFVGDELVMRGLQMEGYSVEDDGAGVSFNVYVYNAQPGVTIDYATGNATATE